MIAGQGKPAVVAPSSSAAELSVFNILEQRREGEGTAALIKHRDGEASWTSDQRSGLSLALLLLFLAHLLFSLSLIFFFFLFPSSLSLCLCCSSLLTLSNAVVTHTRACRMVDVQAARSWSIRTYSMSIIPLYGVHVHDKKPARMTMRSRERRRRRRRRRARQKDVTVAVTFHVVG